jgi:hypothetical protein
LDGVAQELLLSVMAEQLCLLLVSLWDRLRRPLKKGGPSCSVF